MVRFQGGHNAGHTLVVGDKVYKLSLLPSGIVRGTPSVIGNGVVLDPWHLKSEIEKLRGQGVEITPDILKIALQFLHGTCQGPGCMVPAKFCDYDHRIPFPEGPTTGDNLGPLCRRHHGYKGHGLLHWTTRAQPRG